jgi:hypothetical protein
MEILRKLTIKNTGWNTSELKAAVTKAPSTDILKIAGVITAIRPGQTQLGEYAELVGQFQAVNLESGEMFQSSKAILPGFIADPMVEAHAGGQEVEFAIQIGVKRNEGSVVGYEFSVKPLVEPKVSDKLAKLLDMAKIDTKKKLAAA